MTKAILVTSCFVIGLGVILAFNSTVTVAQLTEEQMSKIVGAQSEGGDIDCQATSNQCPWELAPVGGANSPCDTEGAACDTDETWCQDATAEETCSLITSWGWDCGYYAPHSCTGYVGKCVDMLGTLACTGRQETGSADCGSVTQCYY